MGSFWGLDPLADRSRHKATIVCQSYVFVMQRQAGDRQSSGKDFQKKAFKVERISVG